MSINEVQILPFSILNMGQFQENGCVVCGEKKLLWEIFEEKYNGKSSKYLSHL